MGYRYTESEGLPCGTPRTVRRLAEPGGKGENDLGLFLKSIYCCANVTLKTMVGKIILAVWGTYHM